MPHRLEREPYPKPLSPASSDTSVSSNTHAISPRCPQRDFINPRPVQTLPPLRAFLREEGIDADIEPRQPRFIGATHEIAREEARRRALRPVATRCHTRMNPLLGYEHRGTFAYEQPTIHSPDDVRRPGYSRSGWGTTGIVIAENLHRTRELPDDQYHYRLLVGTTVLHESLSHPYDHMDLDSAQSKSVWWGDINLLYRPLPPVPPTVRNEVVSPILSRKRPLPAYLEQSDDEDSEGDSSGRSRASNTPGTGKGRPAGQGDVETSDSDTHEGDDEEQRVSPRAPGKPSGRLKAEKRLDNGPSHEYFSSSGIKLEVIELPVKYDTKEWLKHVEQCPEGSKAPWRCTWQTMKNGSPVPCDYSSKKHLVKRHIEATHLCIKRFQCTWCEKTFTQRSNVAGCHLNTHTGASPHGCDFCGDRFKDPSKRHKHMLRNHGYRPGESRKKFRSEESAQGQSVHESLEPWKVAGARDG
ncbi:hypothetical protein F5148DRAFT_1319097 [Russula earlei]|uniref:Uncharacterized protein n=1 Tax=Russula earlei TaxID=71964 RepID=A0ACC0UQG6_9AGAM|nr:hypothetical protein F5148DRAFT_1319097 [Russula earlei]